MATLTLRVRAKGEGRLPLIDSETHSVIMGRFCGRDRDHNPLPEGEIVPAISYYHQAVALGDLEIVSSESHVSKERK